jgi:outer membrane protein assembly factor BamB
MRVLSGWLLVTLSMGPVAAAGDAWPEFRGPHQNGHADAKGLPLRWSEAQNVQWKTPIHGQAWGSPVVQGDQVWLPTATGDGKRMYAICVDRVTGRIVHDLKLFDVPNPRPLGNEVNTYASPSPVIEPGRVYVTFGSYGTACLDTADGKIIWSRRDLPCNHYRGPASSPVLFDDLLIMNMDGSDYQYVVALNKKTGKTVWKTDRSTDFNDLQLDGTPIREGDFRKAFNTPIVVRTDDGLQIISPGAKAAFAYDPRDGRELWTVCYTAHSTASRSVFGYGMAFINVGYSKPELWAVRVDGRGDVTDTHVAWKCTRGVPGRASPLLIDGRIYMLTDKGVASCLDAKTGEEIWRQRIGGNYSASSVYVDGRIYFFSEAGKTTVLMPGTLPEILARNMLDDGFMASPAVAGKAFFLRTRSHLYRIEE